MEDREIILIAVAGFIIYLYIIYQIIRGAVSSALKLNEYYGSRQLRLAIFKMVKDGHNREEIIEVLNATDDDFWKILPGGDGSDEKVRITDFEKAKGY